MRVLVASHNYPRSPGDPAGAFIARLAQGVAERGHAVFVVAPHVAGTPLEEQQAGVTIRRFRYGPDLLEQVAYRGDLHRPWRAPARALMLPFFLAAYRRAVRRAVRQFRPDLIHAHWWFPGGWAATGHPVPLVVTCHGTDVRLLEQVPLFRGLALRVLREAAAVTTVSQFLGRDLRGLLGVRAPVTQVTPMPVDLDRFAAVAGTPPAVPSRILFAGNLLRSKGVDLLIRAMPILAARGVACRLRIVGDGPEKPALQRLAQAQKVAYLVEFAGKVSLPDMAAEYASSTVTVLPTRGRAEGLGLVLVEALMAGCAVVGSPAGGIPEVVIHGETGLLARDGDPGDLADQLQRMLTDGELRRETVARGREYVTAKYAPAAAVSHVLDLYHAALDRTTD